MDELGFGYTPPSPEEQAINRRQQAIYNTLSLYKNYDGVPLVDDVLEFAKKLEKFVTTGE